MSSDSGKVLGYSILGFILGLYFFFNSFRKFREAKLITDTPTSKIRSLAMGRVEIYGEVLPNIKDLIKAPFSNKDCVYCKWTIEEYRRSGKHSRWVTVRRGSMGNYFFLKDDTGTVLINPSRAHVDIPKDFESRKVTPVIDKFLLSQGVSHKVLFFNKTMRFREYFLEKGDKVYIMGQAGDNPFVDDATSERNEADIMIQKGKLDSFYYITDKPEKEILKKYHRLVWGGMIGGGGLATLCLFVILVLIGLI